jgi:hypothetical protein
MRLQDKRQPAFEDTDLMTFGGYKGELICDVPASYLKWLWEKTDIKQYSTTKPIETSNSLLKDKQKLANYIWNSHDALAEELGESFV